MIHRHLAAAGVLLATVHAMVACATQPPVRYYEISALAAPAAVMHPDLELFVAEIRLPETVSRAEMVVQRTANESEVLDGQRWLSPMDDQVRRAVMSDLRADLPDVWVTGARATAAGPKRYTLRLEIQQLVLVKGGSARIVATWTIGDEAAQIIRRGRGVFEARASDDGYEAVVIAASTAVERLSGQIATSLSQGQSGAVGPSGDRQAETAITTPRQNEFGYDSPLTVPHSR